MSHNIDELKRKLRQLKKLETDIRFSGRVLTGNENYVWSRFFSTKNGDEKVRYPLHLLENMSKQEFKAILSEYYSMVYYLHYKETGILPKELYDPELLKKLELPPDSTGTDIKKRFRELVKKHHPDYGGDNADFLELMDVYRRLTGNK